MITYIKQNKAKQNETPELNNYQERGREQV